MYRKKLHMIRIRKGVFLEGLVSLVILASLLPTGALALTELRVNGEDILVLTNDTVQCGSGTAVYDPAISTLTLDGATLDKLYITDAPSFFRVER